MNPAGKLIVWSGVALIAVIFLAPAITRLNRPADYDKFTREADFDEGFDAEAAVRRQLRDPDSAQFERKKLKNPNGSVCGAFSAKNGFGGYGQKELFYVGPTRDVYFDDMHLSRPSFSATKFCAQSLVGRPELKTPVNKRQSGRMEGLSPPA